MSWSNIAAALTTRLQAVQGVGKAHGRLRYDSEGFEETAFKALFMANGSVNAWQITRTNRTALRSPDDSRVTKVTHTVSIRANLSLVDPGTGATNTEDTFQALLDAVCDNFDTGDHTLGGVAITHSIPQAGQIGHAMFYGSILCHDATITMSVEENLTRA